MDNIRPKRMKEFEQYFDKLLTIDEAAAVMKVSRRTVFRFIKDDELKVVKLSHAITRIRFDELRKFIMSHQ
jgi:excisionase family DNA binding protein